MLLWQFVVNSQGLFVDLHSAVYGAIADWVFCGWCFGCLSWSRAKKAWATAILNCWRRWALGWAWAAAADYSAVLGGGAVIGIALVLVQGQDKTFPFPLARIWPLQATSAHCEGQTFCAGILHELCAGANGRHWRW